LCFLPSSLPSLLLLLLLLRGRVLRASLAARLPTARSLLLLRVFPSPLMLL
jgi:hypothetical protein